MLNHENIPELKIERMADKYGAFILLTQDNCGNSESVALHMIHLRFLAEQFGLVPTSDPDGAKTIATLQRRLRLLQSRIDHLAKWLAGSEQKLGELLRAMPKASAGRPAEIGSTSEPINRGAPTLAEIGIDYAISHIEGTAAMAAEFCTDMGEQA